MGRGSEFICKTCKIRCDLGYSSYSGWLDSCHTVEEFDNAAEHLRKMSNNQNLRQCLVEHQGHDYLTVSEDWVSEYKNKDGTIDLGYDKGMITDWLVVPDYGSYQNKALQNKDK